jgi:hypothetical protein
MRIFRLTVKVFPSAIALFVLLESASSQPAEKGDAAKTPNYYPLEEGNAWYYKLTIEGKEEKITAKITRAEFFNGKFAMRLEVPSLGITEHLLQTGHGVYRFRYNDVAISPPFQLLPYPAKVGAKWKGEFSAVTGKTRFPPKSTFEGEIQSEEDVVVPAGKYKALKVAITITSNAQESASTFWFAKDVGIVKQSVRIGKTVGTSELEKFEQKK